MSAYSRTRRVTHLTYLDARIDWIIGLRIFVRSLGWDPGYQERFRNGPENKIHIRQCSFWSSELFRVNRYCTGTSRTFRSGTNVAPLVGRGHGPMRECPGRIGPGAQGPIRPSRPD